MSFRAISGHRRLLKFIARAIKRDAIPPSLLFEGPAGVGKRTTALAVAQAVNCLAPVMDGEFEWDACGACHSCRRTLKALHPDVRVVESGETGNIKIEQVREVIDSAAYRPFEGRRRVVIIDRAEQLGEPAQNALLKTLEEPRPSSIFILVSSRPDLLLPTVRSRCSRLRFGRLAIDEIVTVLVDGCGYSRADAQTVAPLADGSVQRALDARADELTAVRATVRHVLRRVARERNDHGRLAAAKDLAAQRTTGSAAGERDRLALHLEAMSSLLRDVAVLNSRAGERRLANTDLRAEVEELARNFDDRRTLRAFTAVDRALFALKRNASPKNVADWLSLQL